MLRIRLLPLLPFCMVIIVLAAVTGIVIAAETSNIRLFVLCVLVAFVLPLVVLAGINFAVKRLRRNKQ